MHCVKHNFPYYFNFLDKSPLQLEFTSVPLNTTHRILIQQSSLEIFSKLIISLNVLVDTYHHKVTILDVLYMYYSQYINLVSEDEDPPDQSNVSPTSPATPPYSPLTPVDER